MSPTVLSLRAGRPAVDLLDRWLPLSGDEAARRALALSCKRLVDIVGAAVLLVLAAPLLLLLAPVIKASSHGTVIFRQKRIGQNARPFEMYKLRTMVDGAVNDEERLARTLEGRTFLKLAHDPRITWLGSWLRRTSLDELPQLYNVLQGQMSLVGPRPLLACDLCRFPRDGRMKRFLMKPGLTGLWQVSGRSLLSDEERLRLDLAYVDEWNLGRDLGILLRTLPAVLSGRGAW